MEKIENNKEEEKAPEAAEIIKEEEKKKDDDKELDEEFLMNAIKFHISKRIVLRERNIVAERNAQFLVKLIVLKYFKRKWQYQNFLLKHACYGYSRKRSRICQAKRKIQNFLNKKIKVHFIYFRDIVKQMPKISVGYPKIYFTLVSSKKPYMIDERDYQKNKVKEFVYDFHKYLTENIKNNLISFFQNHSNLKEKVKESV